MKKEKNVKKNETVERKVVCNYSDTQCSNCRYFDPNCKGGWCDVFNRPQSEYGWCHNWKW